MSLFALAWAVAWVVGVAVALMFVLGGTRHPRPVVPETRESSPPAGEAGGELVELDDVRRRRRR